MPANDRQLAQRERFLALYFDGSPEFRGNLKASAQAAEYSKTSITFKQGKFRKYIAEETKRRGQHHAEENPANTRSLISGRILPVSVVLQRQAERVELRGERVGTAHKPTEPSLEEPLVPPEKDTLPPWSRDQIDGADQRLYFDHNGEPKTAIRERSLADSYIPKYLRLDGQVRASWEVARPVWAEPDFSDLFPEPENDGEPRFVDEKIGDAIGDPDALPQARFRPDEGPTNEIFAQVVKG